MFPSSFIPNLNYHIHIVNDPLMLLDPFIILFLIGKYANSGSGLMLMASYIFSVFACIHAALDTKIMIVKCV